MASLESFVTCVIKVDQQELRHTLSSVVLEQHVDNHHVLKVRVMTGGVVRSGDEFAEHGTFRNFLGKSISVHLEPQGRDVEAGRVLEFVGVVTRVSFDNSVDETNEVTIEAHSPTIALDGARRNAIEFEMKASDLIKSRLSSYQITMGTVETTPKTLPYCVQYRETDYAYIMRMASGNGLFAYYDGQKFHVAKAAAGREEELKWRQDLGLFSLGLGTANPNQTGASWDAVNKEALSNDYDGAPSGAAPSDLSRVSINASAQVYGKLDFSADHKAADMASLDAMLKHAKDAAVGRMVSCRGESVVPAVKIGSCVKISGMGDMDGQYYVRHVTHRLEESGKYHNAFECIPLDVAYPPLSHPLPRLTDLQSAIVTDLNDPEKQGRVKVKFYWRDGESSCWVRLACPYAGADRGWYTIPEIDDEVLVAFEHGDPDMPVVVGSLFNGKDKPPSDAPNEKNDVKMFLTRGGNLLKFVDKDGSEELIVTQKDGKNKITLALEGPSITIESEGDIAIKGKTIALESTSGDITVKSGGAVKQESTADFQIKGGMNLKAEGSMNCEIKGGAQTKVEGGAMTEIKGGLVKIN